MIIGAPSNPVVGRQFHVTVHARSFNAGDPAVASINWGDGTQDVFSNPTACPAMGPGRDARIVPTSSTDPTFAHTYRHPGAYIVQAAVTTVCSSVIANGSGRLLATVAG